MAPTSLLERLWKKVFDGTPNTALPHNHPKRELIDCISKKPDSHTSQIFKLGIERAG